MRNFVRLGKLLVIIFLFGVVNTAQSAEMTPKQFYLQYHQKCLVVSSPKALLQWRSKDSIERDQPMSDEEIEQVYPMIKDMMAKNITVLSEEIKGDRATLKVTGDIPPTAADPVETPKSSKSVKKGAAETANKPPVAKSKDAKPEQQMGVVLLVKEGGAWKMDHESWTSH